MFMEKLRLKTEDKWNDMLKQLVKTTDIVFLEADQRIIEQGKRDMSGMYTIMSGSVKVIVQNHNSVTDKIEEEFVNELHTDNYFGEIALLTDGYRTASVVSINYCALAKLSL
jgi:CRP-like cAMP-binding protein